MKRPRRTPEEARRLILGAARELIAETGPEGLRLQEIAARAGISHPLILHHFGSREGLVRALTEEAARELGERLIAASASGVLLEDQLDRVFDAFRDGLAQRLVWLAAIGNGSEEPAPQVMREIADAVHARRVAAALPGSAIARADTERLIHLVAVAALGDAIYGARLRKSAGLPATAQTARDFRTWFAALIRAHESRNAAAEGAAKKPLVSPASDPI